MSAIALTTAGIAVATAVPGAASDASMRTGSPMVRVVSGFTNATGAGTALGADRTQETILAAQNPAATPAASAKPNPWHAMPAMPGVVKDISFANPKIGYAAAELGVIWKTTDGGEHWTAIVNVGFPLYFYGVDALSTKEVVVSGFDNVDGTAVVWRTVDGGTSWNSDITFPQGWGGRVRFTDDQHGMLAGLTGSQVWSTSTGGETADEWAFTKPDPADGWIGSQFTLLPNQRAYLSGISFCRSKTGGAAWNCEHSVDSVFDGPTSFVNRKVGWVGGGSISPEVEGWVHRTTDAGHTWSGRTLDGPWPIRQIEALDKNVVWAVGGDSFSEVGGMYYSNDGGATWKVDLETGMEMASCDHMRVHNGADQRVWCVGYAFNGSSFTSKVYRVTVPH